MTEFYMLYSTFPNREEALFAARALVEKRLAACANLYNEVTSVYRWQGGIQQENEVTLIAKTRKEKIPAAIEAIKHLHSYQLPCIVAYKMADGFPPFLQWIEDETV